MLLTNRFTAKYTTMEYAMTMRWQTRRTMFVASQPVERKQNNLIKRHSNNVQSCYRLTNDEYSFYIDINTTWVWPTTDGIAGLCSIGCKTTWFQHHSNKHSPSQTWARHDALKPPIMSKLSLAKAMMSKSSSSPATAPATCTQRFVHLTGNMRHTTAVDDGPRPELNSH